MKTLSAAPTRLRPAAAPISLLVLDDPASYDFDDRELLSATSADRGDQMERLRNYRLGGGWALDHRHRTPFLYLTSLFEGPIWLLRQLGLAPRSLDDYANATLGCEIAATPATK